METAANGTAPPNMELKVSGGAAVDKKKALLPPRAAGSTPRPGSEFKLRDCFRVLAYHYRLLVIVGLLTLAGAFAYTWLQPERYKARAVLIRVDMKGYASRADRNAALRIALETVRGGGLTKLAEKRLKRKYKEEPLPGDVPQGRELAAMIEASIDARADELTITAAAIADQSIEREKDQGERVARVADAFAGALLEYIENQRREGIRRAEEKLHKRLNDKSDELRKLLTNMFKYRARLEKSGDRLLPLPSEIEEVMSRLEKLKELRQNTRFRERELSKRLDKLKASIQSAGGGKKVPELGIDDLKRALVAAEMALARAEIRYQSTHPTYVKRQNERDQLQEKVREHAGGSRTDLGRLQAQRDIVEAEQQGVQARLSTIEEAIGDMKKDLDAVVNKLKTGGVDEKFAEMLRQKHVLETAIVSSQKHLERLEGAVPISLPRLELLSPAAPPGSPHSPRWITSMAFGLGLSALLVLIAVFIAENLEDRIRDQRDLMQNFDLPFLGPVPLWREGEPLLIDLDRPRAVIADVYGVLRNNIGYALPPGAPKVLLVASSVVGEGKSTIAANLAISYCLDGNNVLLVDTDLRRPRAHRLLERLCPQASGSAGLSGYLAGSAGLADILFRASVPGLSIISAGRGAVNPSKLLGSGEMRGLIEEVKLSIISAGRGAVNPSKLLGSGEMRGLIEEVKGNFDAVILDGPAVLPVVDSTVVSGLASGVLLVVASKRAPAEQVATAVARLEHVKAPIIGMVLNRQPGGSRGYYHYYGSRYGYGYGSGYSHHSGEEKTGTE